MNKAALPDFFGVRTLTDVGGIVGVSSSAIAQWPDPLPPRIADRVIAALVRAGRAVPSELLTPPPPRASRRPKAPAVAADAAAPSEPKPKRGRPRRKTALGPVGLKGAVEPQTPEPSPKPTNAPCRVCPHCGRCVGRLPQTQEQ